MSVKDLPHSEKELARHPEPLSQLFLDAYHHVEEDPNARRAAVGCAVVGAVALAGLAVCVTRGRVLPELLGGGAKEEVNLMGMSRRSLLESKSFATVPARSTPLADNLIFDSRHFDFLKGAPHQSADVVLKVDRGVPDLAKVGAERSPMLAHRPMVADVAHLKIDRGLPDVSLTVAGYSPMLRSEQPIVIGGTGAVAPELAATLAKIRNTLR